MGVLSWFRRRASGAQDDCTDCHGVQEHCSEFVDGELPPTMSAQFRAHMDACPDCNGFVATFRATVLTIRDLPRRSSPATLRERVSSAIARERGAR
ncbi:MAG: zf-HC2 domain-containing protein [Chloroflexota bacterium]